MRPPHRGRPPVWDGHLSRAADSRKSNCQKLWIRSCSHSLVVQVDEPFEGAQAACRAGSGIGWW
jgi:hypothetical protein